MSDTDEVYFNKISLYEVIHWPKPFVLLTEMEKWMTNTPD